MQSTKSTEPAVIDIPISFWYCKDDRLALPVIWMEYFKDGPEIK